MEISIFGKYISLRKEVLIALSLVFAVSAALIGFAAGRNQSSIVIDKSQDDTGIEENAPTDTDKESAGSKNVDDEIRIYVVGCVKSPGIITLKKGQIIDDAIKAAGGPDQEADLNNINLAYKLSDNTMVKIRSKNISQPLPQKSEAGAGVEIVRDSGGAVENDSTDNSKTNGKVNINTASAAELEELPEIGKETAKDIISNREKNGPFISIDDIKRISGIKEKRFSKIKDFITVD